MSTRFVVLIPALTIPVVALLAAGVNASRRLSLDGDFQRVTAVRADVARVVSVIGSVVPAGRTAVTTSTAARIVSMHVRMDESVAEGQLLATLDQSSWQAEVARRQVAVARAERALRQPGDDGDRRIRELELTEARLELSRVRRNRHLYELRSPKNGKIVAVNGHVGEVLTPAGPPPFVIADGLAEVEAEADEFEIGGIAKGQPAVVFVDAWSARPLTGSVASVPVLRRGRSAGAPAMYGFTVSLDETPETLKWGFTARAEIEVARVVQAVVVPVAAVVSLDTFDYVIVEDRTGTRRAVPVQAGLSDNFVVAVDGAVEAGDAVLTGDAADLRRLVARPRPSHVESR